MACTATYNTASETLGHYGIYNDFYVFIENTSGSTTNLKFRIRVTDADSNQYTVDVVPNAANDAITNPLIRLRDTYFKGEWFDFGEAVNAEGWNTVQIEVGEISGDPATFQGYDTDDTFYFYNGYSKDKQQQLNYREPSWYDTTPYLLPKVKKEIYVLEDDIEVLTIPNPLTPSNGNTYYATEINWTYKNAAGATTSTATVDLTLRPTFSSNPTGYWQFNINTATLHNGTNASAEITVTWDTGEPAEVTSETIILYPQVCQQKFNPYRLAWINRYGGWEFENFQMLATESIQIARGKKILGTGVDYDATTFATIKDVDNPQMSEFGKSYERRFKIRSNWLNQDSLDALEEAYTSPKVLMYDEDDNLFPVIVEESTYEIQDVRQGVKKVEMTVSIANRQPYQLQ